MLSKIRRIAITAVSSRQRFSERGIVWVKFCCDGRRCRYTRLQVCAYAEYSMLDMYTNKQQQQHIFIQLVSFPRSRAVSFLVKRKVLHSVELNSHSHNSCGSAKIFSWYDFTLYNLNIPSAVNALPLHITHTPPRKLLKMYYFLPVSCFHIFMIIFIALKSWQFFGPRNTHHSHFSALARWPDIHIHSIR